MLQDFQTKKNCFENKLNNKNIFKNLFETTYDFFNLKKYLLILLISNINTFIFKYKIHIKWNQI